jgi:hypothetical protein
VLLNNIETTSGSSTQLHPSSEQKKNVPKGLHRGLGCEVVKILGNRSLFAATCKKQEFHFECSEMARWRPWSPKRGEPKVMQRGSLFLLDVRLMLSNSHKVKREAIDPPRECPVTIN